MTANELLKHAMKLRDNAEANGDHEVETHLSVAVSALVAAVKILGDPSA